MAGVPGFYFNFKEVNMAKYKKIEGLVYKIIFKDKKLYIGQTKNSLNLRINQHKKNFKNILGYEIIDIATTKRNLDKKEAFWILYYKSNNPQYGLNKTIMLWNLFNICNSAPKFEYYITNFTNKENIFNYDYKKLLKEIKNHENNFNNCFATSYRLPG
jgi:hypothetical protein